MRKQIKVRSKIKKQINRIIIPFQVNLFFMELTSTKIKTKLIATMKIKKTFPIIVYKEYKMNKIMISLYWIPNMRLMR